MGRNWGGAPPLFGKGELGAYLTNVVWAEACLHTKWHLDHAAVWSQ